MNQVSARVGDNIEIKCDVTGSPTPPIVWRRHGLDLSQLSDQHPPSQAEDELKVFPDGSLYINNVRLIHAGNYTCHAQRNKDVVQTHVLHVHSKFFFPRNKKKMYSKRERELTRRQIDIRRAQSRVCVCTSEANKA